MGLADKNDGKGRANSNGLREKGREEEEERENQLDSFTPLLLKLTFTAPHSSHPYPRFSRNLKKYICLYRFQKEEGRGGKE